MSERNDFKEMLINKILSLDGTLFGRYIYKTIINGDSSRDLDVVHAEPYKLVSKLQEEFYCVRSFLEKYYGIISYERGVAIDCQRGKENIHVDIVKPFPFKHTPPQWFIYDKHESRCNSSINPDTCFNKLIAIRNRDMDG